MTQTVALPESRPERSGRRPRRTTAPPLRHRRWLISSVTLVLAAGIWAAVAAWVDDPILPRPAHVGEQVIAIIASGAAVTNFAASITKILAGFALAMAGGLVVGFVMGRSRFMAAYFSLPLFVLGNMPGLTYAVFGLLIFGVGAGGPVVVSALVALPFIAMNVAEGVRSIDGRLLAMCRAFERSHFDIVRHLYLPALTTFVFAGVRYGFAMAWKVEALTEVFGASNGVGFMIRKAYQEFRVDDMLAWTTLFIVAMVLIERVLAYLEGRFFAWRKEIA
ncbi:ABC transporter permease [Mycolicibacterium goodii]|uniref:ABC transporter permease subunit n=1 Tax=Mycolicibacterium goodii TaxID=134601 RepID=A0ABS6HR92_MYCGD|nr:ABC transporter permease subunit [Mycolicibacterium goodii]MBU8820094.1 ABC transporter permease subunit [Mycolicibacterium goodii]MBU8823838.1 ABC transporter permease subunit [Mycolicibacterium goodii]MBU8836483.1 ABC transporter permease subunit [Mycolicibacterium goodii]